MKPMRLPKVCEIYAYAEPAWATRCVNAMNDSATNTIATVPMAKASGAAAPAACTTNVMLKAAVTVGQMTETDKPMASGRLKRLTKFTMRVCVLASPHHIGCNVGIRNQ